VTARAEGQLPGDLDAAVEGHDVEAAAGVNGEDIVGPFGLGLAERADRHGLLGQHEELDIRLERRGHEALDTDGAALELLGEGAEILVGVVKLAQLEHVFGCGAAGQRRYEPGRETGDNAAACGVGHRDSLSVSIS
jgi:hypothetical protein